MKWLRGGNTLKWISLITSWIISKVSNSLVSPVVLVLICIDFVLEIVCVLITKQDKKILLKDIGRIMIWLIFLTISTLLMFNFGTGLDWAIHTVSGSLIYFILINETLAILRHTMTVSLYFGIDLPGLSNLIDLIEKWGKDELGLGEAKNND